MRAAVYRRYGNPEVIKLEEILKPVPNDNEVLVRVIASSMNRTDCGYRKPEYPVIIRLINGLIRPKINIMGSEFSGIVESVGKNVNLFNPKDKVFGLKTDKFGTHSEYICISENASISQMPDNISYEEAAGVCDGLMLALAYIREIDFSKNIKILINGASGSIGIAFLQLANYYGAEITAVCSKKSIPIIKSLGVEKIIDFNEEDFTKTDEKFDVVFDAVGKSSYFKCKKLLNNGGLYFSTELGVLAQNVLLPFFTKIFSNTKIKFPIPKDNKKDVEFFKMLIEKWEYKPVIDKVYSFEEIVEAAKYVETGSKVGNVVIKITQ